MIFDYSTIPTKHGFGDLQVEDVWASLLKVGYIKYIRGPLRCPGYVYQCFNKISVNIFQSRHLSVFPPEKSQEP